MKHVLLLLCVAIGGQASALSLENHGKDYSENDPYDAEVAAAMTAELEKIFEQALVYGNCRLSLERDKNRQSPRYNDYYVVIRGTGEEEATVIADPEASPAYIDGGRLREDKYLPVHQSLTVAGDELDLTLTQFKQYDRSKTNLESYLNLITLNFDIYGGGSNRKVLGYIKRTLQLTMNTNSGEVKSMTVQDKFYRRVLFGHLPTKQKTLVNCD